MEQKQEHEETLKGSSKRNSSVNDHRGMRGWFSEPQADLCLKLGKYVHMDM